MEKFTPDMSDEELDRLFREAAGNYNPPFDPQAWESMEKKLDGGGGGENGRGGKNIARLIGVLLLIALLGGYGYFRHYRNEMKNKADRKQAVPVSAVNAPAKKFSGLKQAGAGQLSRRRKPGEAITGNKAGSVRTAPGHGNVSGKEVPANDILRGRTGYRMDGIAFGGKASSGAPGPVAINHPAAVAATGITGSSQEADSGQNSEGHAAAPGKAGSHTAAATFSRWRLGLVAGPDMATVKFRQWTTPGVNAGLMLGYQITKRLSVESGVLYSSKIYTARPQDYHPKQPIPNYYYLKEVDANCSVIDVPVNLRYDLYRKKQRRIFVSTGLSSFWMKEENYTYKFNWSQPGSNTEVYNQNRHLFSIWNVSAGYEMPLNNHFSLQAAPFVKLPLSGIGYGRVKLTSTGVLFSLKYGL